jgi:dipeptidyl aminopeptidase/acylaminoacyl peptidase
MYMVNRRGVLAGGLLAGLLAGGSYGRAFGQARGLRVFRIEDGLDRTDVTRAVGCDSGQWWALEILPPLPRRGRFGAISSGIPADSQLWLCDARLEHKRSLSDDAHWDWAPDFSPMRHDLAWLTSADGAAVTLAAWIDGIRRDFNERVEIEVSFSGAVDSAPGRPSPFMWLGDGTILFVKDASTPYTPELRVSASFEYRAALGRRLAAGESSARVWSPESPTCGASNSLCRLDPRTGHVSTLFEGDVRGVSVSPDGRYAAILSATGHLPADQFRTVNMPFHRNPFGDVLVRTRLFVVDLASSRTLDIPAAQSVGVVSPRELPLWSADSRLLSTPGRDTFEEATARYSVSLIEVRTGKKTVLAAESQLDAEVLAHLATRSQDIGALAARRRLRDHTRTSSAASHVTGFAGGLYVDDGASAFIFDREGHSVDVSDRRLPAKPALALDGTLFTYDIEDGIPYRWTCADTDIGRHGFQALSMEGSSQVLAVNRHRDALLMSLGSSGTSFGTISGNVVRRSGLVLNSYLAEVLAPKGIAVPYRNADGEARTGMLLLPTSYVLGPRPPVVMWAYPGNLPDPKGWLPQVNNQAAKFYPFQLLLAAGFAVFWAELPRYGADPTGRILSELLPCVTLLRGRADVDGTRTGFFGHSNAGYVALTLAAHTDAFRAIVAAGSFPDWAAVNVTADVFYRDTVCGGFVMQQSRYFTEARAMPYSIGAPRWSAREEYLRNSPIEQLQNLKTPLLFIEGEMDTSAREVEMAYTIAQATGVPTELAFYQGESHVFNSRANVIDSHDRALRWFTRYLTKQNT